MRDGKTSATLAACGMIVILGLSACGTAEPIEVDEISRPDEIQAGRGLLSKDEGALVHEF